MRIRLVTQEDETGCGLACAASITDQSYDSVKSIAAKLFNWTERKKKYYLKVHELERLLEMLSINSARTKFPGWNNFSGVAIVGVKIHGEESGYHHWVVAFRSGKKLMIMDPRHGEVYDGNLKNRRNHVKGRKRSNYFPIANSCVHSISL